MRHSLLCHERAAVVAQDPVPPRVPEREVLICMLRWVVGEVLSKKIKPVAKEAIPYSASGSAGCSARTCPSSVPRKTASTMNLNSFNTLLALLAMESLEDIGQRHGTDKKRGLLRIYEGFLSPIRDRPVSILEIGVLAGASLRTWRDYFSHGQVCGIDIEPEAAEHADERVRVFIGSQSDTAFLDSVVAETGQLDVIVDDGSHQAADQITSLLHLWPHVKPGGLYIVEDIHTSYFSGYEMGWRQTGTTVEFLKGVVDDVHEMWHDKPVEIRACVAITFVAEACLLRKRGYTGY
jgi:Methyltransferase domain